MSNEHRVAVGLVERIGLKDSILVYQPTDGEKTVETGDIANHAEAIRRVLDKLVAPTGGVIKSLSEITAIGHRVVHGGEKFSKSVRVDSTVLAAIRENVPLAPLHNPANITGIEAMMRALPGVDNVAVFDTAFHAAMPAESYMYAVPYEWYERHHVRRYGFHGTSHRFVSERAAEMLGIAKERFNCITCHMGNGSSFTAVKNGKSYDTSMGMTPLEGLMMGTRCGNVDPSIVFFMVDELGYTLDQVKDVLNKKGVTYKNIWFKSDSEAGKFTSNLFSFPTTYVIDQNGNIVGEPIVGAISSAEQRAALDKLIDQAIANSEQ